MVLLSGLNIAAVLYIVYLSSMHDDKREIWLGLLSIVSMLTLLVCILICFDIIMNY